MAGIGLLPNPWHLHQCPLHKASPALLEALEGLLAPWSDGHEERKKARAAIRAAKGEGNA